MLFRPKKVTFQKAKKIELFQSGLFMVFVLKSNFLPCMVFGQIKPVKIVF